MQQKPTFTTAPKPSQADNNVQALKTDFRTSAPLPEPPKATQPLPEPKRTKSERVHEGKGYAGGIAHGMLIGLAAGLTAAFLAFSIAGPVLADFAARITMVNVAKDAALRGR
jgi:predicted lipid-binding transport protein (Tim44 family)